MIAKLDGLVCGGLAYSFPWLGAWKTFSCKEYRS